MQSGVNQLVSNADRETLAKIQQELRYIGDAVFDSASNERKRMCLEGTRVDLLDEISAWCRASTGPCIYWLNGIAGTGKSAIAKSVAYRCQQEGHLGGSFFFLRNHVDRGHARKFFLTLAVQLCSKLSGLQSFVLDLLSRDVGVPEKGMQDQWKRLILDPLRNITDKPDRPLCIVVD